MLLDVSLVTKALQNLLQWQIEASPAWPGGTLKVSALPPDRLKDIDDALAIYLFHTNEDPYFKNTAAIGTEEPPGRYTPMALQLFYIMTANSKREDDQAPYFEQLVMGLGIKTLRDTAMIDDTTRVGGNMVLPLPLRGLHNRVRLSLEPVQYSDAPHYWTAGQQPLRLASYYRVTTVMLEPYESRTFAPPVLRYGVFSFARTGPRIDTSASTVTFTSPADGIARQLDVRPAEASIGGNVRFIGSGLRGEMTTVTLSYPFWSEPIDADAAWNVVLTSDTDATMTIAPQIGPGPQTIVPGVYSAHVTVTETRQLPDGSFRRFDQVSNEMPFSIAPRVDAVSPFDGSRQATITGVLFEDPLIKPEDVIVALGFDRLEPAVPPLAPGTFAVLGPQRVQFRVPAAADQGDRRLLRLFVNGVESAPLWVTIP